MKAIAIGEFTRHFRRVRKEACHVKDRGEIVGTWTPVAKKPEPFNVLERVKSYCTKPLPFTGAELLQEKKR